MKKINKSDILFYLFLLGYIGFFLLITGPFNLGVSADSVSYLDIANNVFYHNSILRNGKLITTHWPPGYPVLLGLFSKLCGYEPLVCGRYFNLILIIIVAIFYKKILESISLNKNTSLFLTVIFLSSYPFLLNFQKFWSEPLFILVFLIIIDLLINYINTEKKLYLLLAGFFSGLLFLVRYAALGFIGGVVIFILLNELLKMRNNRYIFHLRMIKKIIWYISPVVFWLLLWWLYAFIHHSNFSDRKFEVHIIKFQHFIAMVKTFVIWFVNNGKFLYPISMFLFIVFIALLLISFIKNKSEILLPIIKNNIILLFFTLIFSYILFLVVSISFFDNITPLDSRILFPVFVLLTLIFGYYINFCWHIKYWATPIVLFLYAFLISIKGIKLSVKYYSEGSGYTSKFFKDIPYVNINYCLKANKKVYVNTPGSFLRYFFKTQKGFYFFPKELSKLKEEIIEGKGCALYLNYYDNKKNFFLKKKWLIQNLDSEYIHKFSNGYLFLNSTKTRQND